MKINFLQKTAAPNFGSTELYRAKIKHHLHDCEEAVPVDVFITRLDFSDYARLKREEQEWEGTDYGPKLIDDLLSTASEEYNQFIPTPAFYAVEIPDIYGRKQIRAIAEVSKERNKIKLDYIQVNNSRSMPDIIQGAGSCLLYAAINMAKKCDFDTFSLSSIGKAAKFYKRNKLNRGKENEFHLTKRLYGRNLAMLQEKYSIEKTANEEPLLRPNTP